MTRRAMTRARKRRIHEREGGLCYHCRLPVDMFGPGVRYDHRIGVWLTQRDEDADVFPAHTACDAPKTAADQGIIAKVKRIIRKADPATRKPSRMRSRPFGPSACFQTNPTMKRCLDGKVRPRVQKEPRA